MEGFRDGQKKAFPFSHPALASPAPRHHPLLRNRALRVHLTEFKPPLTEFPFTKYFYV